MLVVTAQAAVPTEPPKRPFHHPAARQHRKALAVWGAAHDLYRPAKLLAYVGTDIFIGSIGPDELEATPAIMHVAVDAVEEPRQDQLAPRAIRYPGALHDDGQQQPQHVYDNMALAPIGLLVYLHPAGLSAFRGLDALAVANGGTGVRVPSRLLPRGLHEHGIEPLPQPAARPAPEVPVDGLPGREVPRQHAPLTARAGHGENRIEDQPRRPFARTPPQARRWKPVHQLFPFRRRQVRRVRLCEGNHPSSLPDAFSKHSLRTLRQNPWKSFVSACQTKRYGHYCLRL